jgi:uncharacterized protein YjbJ (UPF0337 family)
MDSNILKGNWNIVKGKLRQAWGDLTDNDVEEIAGKKGQLIGKLQKQYGYTKDEAESKVKKFEDKLSDDS